MMATCMRYANGEEEAIEMLNMGFLKVFNAIGQYQSKGSFEGWIRRIMINTSLEQIRRNLRYKQAMNFDSEVEPIIGGEVTDNLLMEDVYKIIQQLPLDNRTVFSLYFVDGYTHKEIGEMLGIPVGTSKWQLSEAKKKFVKIAKQYYREYIESDSF